MIGIIGGGISGLATAYYLQQQQQEYVLLESCDKAGGVICSTKAEGKYGLELGPNSLLCDEGLREFLREIDLRDEIVEANPISKDRYIFRDGKYRRLPSSPPSLLFNTFFSWSTKWAIFKERSNSSRSPGRETLSGFFRRRFSQELVDYALDPFVAGIYAGDPDRLLIDFAFPQLLEYEREYGSIIRGFIKNKGAGRKESVTFKKGMQQLTDTIAEKVNIVYNAPVEQLLPREKGKYSLNTPKGSWEVDQIVLSTPAKEAAKLLSSIAPAYAAELKKIRYAPMTAIHSAFKQGQVGRPPNGFGGLHPRKEGLFAAGHIWSSSVFPGKCPSDEVLFTTFVGGDQGADKARLPLEDQKAKATEELKEHYRISAGPVFQQAYHWEEALPQYDHALEAVYNSSEQLEEEGVFISSNWKKGISIPDCIKKGRELAALLAQKSPSSSSR